MVPEVIWCSFPENFEKILDLSAKATVKSISEIIAENGRNIFTVTRLAQRIGFRDFLGYHHIFRQDLKQGPYYYIQHPSESLSATRLL